MMTELLLPIPVTLKLEASSGIVYIYDSSGFLLASGFGTHLLTVLQELATHGAEFIREQLAEYSHGVKHPAELSKSSARANIEAAIAQGIRIKRIPPASPAIKKKKTPLGINVEELLENFADLL